MRFWSRFKCPKCGLSMSYCEFPDLKVVEISCDACEYLYLFRPIMGIYPDQNGDKLNVMQKM